MNRQSMSNLTLFDLLARRWQRPAAVRNVAFANDGAAVAYASDDGVVAVAPTADGEPPEARIRVSADVARTTIRPRQTPAPPLVVTASLGAGTVPLRAFGASDFLVGSQTGAVIRLHQDGSLGSPLLRLKNAVVAIDHSAPRGLTAATDGESVVLRRESDGEALTLAPDGEAPVGALAFSPGGDHLALARGGKVEIWAVGDEVMRIDSLACPGPATELRWSRRAPWLACALGEAGFALIDFAAGRTDTITGFPMPVRSIAWSGGIDAVAASGAFRIAAWSVDLSGQGSRPRTALETGRAGLVPVDAVAAHPSTNLVAASYANGQVVIAQLGRRDALSVKTVGGPVAALAWSSDGRHLALGTEDGEAAIASFPPQMFK
ncbi:MAG: hypothetical protein KF914_03010 [Rhizobiaceae bacterium]|nr:hypothetical protein [Rhizobiaceae bacterium]